MKLPKYMIIMSLDAVGTVDLEYLRGLPNFKEFYRDAAYCDDVKSIYPSLTYPAHASIITGKLPCNHKVTNNVLIQPHRKISDWRWQRKYIKGETLYDAVFNKGKTVASFLWPVTGKSKSIKYHIPEIFANRWWDNQIFTSLRNGSKLFQLKMFINHKHLLKGINQPELDNFTMAAALETIKKYKPNLTLIHLTDVDTMKHYENDEEVKKALLRMDERLGKIVKLLKKESMYEETTLVLLGDHSQYKADKIVYLNTFFKEKGWLSYDADRGKIKDYKVLARDCDGSCYIYIKDKNYKTRVYKFLMELKNTGKYGIDKVYTSREAKIKGAGPCSFMIEAKRGYYFQNDAKIKIRYIDENNKYHDMIATHGYDPEKPDYGTFFAMRGVGVNPYRYTNKMSLIDEAPTLAKLLNVELKDVDGRVIEEFLKSEESKNKSLSKENIRND